MRISSLQDKHKDEKLIFVSGAGPSLHAVDPKIINDYPIITVNSAFPKFKDARKLYFLSDDVGVKNYNYYVNILPHTRCIKLLYKKKLAKYAQQFDPEEVVWFNHKWWYSPKDKSTNPTGLVLTKNAEEPIVGARTSLGSALHFAYIMAGADTKIILLGSDCCFLNRHRYYWQFPEEEKVFRVTREPIFSRPNKGTHKGYPVDSHSMDFLKYWDAFAEQNKDTDVHIINASGGIMDSFERLPLDEVLDKYGN